MSQHIDLNDYRDTDDEDDYWVESADEFATDLEEAFADAGIDADEIVEELEGAASPSSNPTPEVDKPDRIDLHERSDVLEVSYSLERPGPVHGHRGFGGWRKPDMANWEVTLKACSELVDVFEAAFLETEPVSLETTNFLAPEAFVTDIHFGDFQINGMPTVTIDLESEAYKRKANLDLP